MADKPIIFSGPMVRALLEGRKTQTRRVLKLADDLTDKTFTGELVNYYGDRRLGMAFHGTTRVQPIRYAPGDRLWVREAWQTDAQWDDVPPAYFGSEDDLYYGADGHRERSLWGDPFKPGRVRPSIHMPRWASRLTLAVTDVRVQRLQEISYRDTCAEGVDCATCAAMGQSACCRKGRGASREAFRELWNSLHGAEAWDHNPWVVALIFDVHRCNIDEMESNND